ncbi:sensor histidine kinase [Paraburkholderia caribensis]|uniref:sensor histidine kinase n=1 Tax=Paraburkholderia caribensis TaxID=75105 RepID=UPI000721125E|nr:HAMP domain-containing sensor histidine kinase [Paraburkholderia caribensis]ALP68520.1 hypothetical protein AN416_37970 [Paraburkholderia caribensis]AUT57875.1 sensor histidine kinase [Paraburkholderia caribensis]
MRLKLIRRSVNETPGGDATRWHVTAFRWLCVYSVIFALSILMLSGFVGWSMTKRIEFGDDSLIHWERMYFHGIPNAGISAAIQARIAGDGTHANYYGLFAPNGVRIAGNIAALPVGLPPDTVKRTLRAALVVDGVGREPVVRAMALRRSNGSTLVIARDLTEQLSIRKAIVDALMGGGLAYLSGSFAVGLLLSWRQLRRVRAMRHATRAISNGDLERRLPTGGGDELDMLAHLVNQMLGRIVRLMGDVKSACDGIAHDLRTPLARVQLLLATASRRTDASGDRETARILDAARQETEQLLVRFQAILRISEIGARRRKAFGPVDMAALVRDLCELYEPLAEDRGVGWLIDVNEVPCFEGDRALLFEAIGNLLDNAVKFTPPGGTVRVGLTNGREGALLSIADDGPGIAESERELVLECFYRAKNSKGVSGSGVGLSIVVAVLDLHGFALRIAQNERSTGTLMRVECWAATRDH